MSRSPSNRPDRECAVFPAAPSPCAARAGQCHAHRGAKPASMRRATESRRSRAHRRAISSHLNLNDCFLEAPAGVRARQLACQASAYRSQRKSWLVHASRCWPYPGVAGSLGRQPEGAAGPARPESAKSSAPWQTWTHARAAAPGRSVGLSATARARAHGQATGRPGGGGLACLGAACSAGLERSLLLGLLALLAVAGVFLMFGLLSGFLRLSERVAEAEHRQDGHRRARHRARRSSTARARVLYRNRALQRLTGTARRPAGDARGAVRRRAAVGAGLLPPQPRRRARRAARRGVLRALGALGDGRAGAGCRSRCARSCGHARGAATGAR